MSAAPPRLPVYYDFASTICFVAHRVLGAMSADLAAVGVELDWRPVDLVEITGWRRDEPTGGVRRENALRVARELGVTVGAPPAWIDSRRAHAVVLALAGTPKEPAWRERVWSAVFEEGRDVGDPREIVRLAGDLDVDVERLDLEPFFVRLVELTRLARQADVTGVPTFDIDFPLAGIQQPDTMRMLFERWVTNHRRRRTER